MEKEYDIFISYRRDGGDKYARTIQQALEKRFKVFLDFDELTDGLFDQRILNAIENSSVFLLILSKGALDRCINKSDWVRQEILHANNCGCHIVPVTIDDTFEGLPPDLPEEIRQIIEPRQFSELQMKTLFKESVGKLIHDRIEDYVKKEDPDAGAEIHIESDVNCDLYKFNVLIKRIIAGVDNLIYLLPGKYKLEFVSSEFPEIRKSQIYSLSNDIVCDFLEVSLIDKVKKAREDAAKKMTLHIVRRNGKFGFADDDDNEIIPCTWDGASNFSEELAMVIENGKSGYINKLGAVVIPCIWKSGGDFSEGLAYVQDTNNLYGFIDKTGKVVIPIKWEHVESFSEGLACVKKRWDDYGYGFIDHNGDEVIKCLYEKARSFSEGLAFCKWQGSSDFIDKSQKYLIESLSWRDAGVFREGLANVCHKSSRRWGYCNKKGNIVIPYIWKNAMPFSEGLASVQDVSSGKWGFINEKGELVIPCSYDTPGCFHNGKCYIKDDNFVAYIDKKGNIIKRM